MERVIQQLSPPRSEHLSLVGPKFIGKTILIREVIQVFGAEPKRGYLCSLFWDLHHNTPRNDDEFFLALGDLLRNGLRQTRQAKLAEYLTGLSEQQPDARQELLRCVFEDLNAEEDKVLLAMDGMDAILASDALTTQLWEFLRSLSQIGSLRFITGSRRRLQEICRGERARTSDFWNVFDDPPTTIPPFRADDWEAVLQPFSERGITLSPGAVTEIKSWTGGVPVLVAGLCRRIWDNTADGAVLDNREVSALADAYQADQPQHLDDLWDDCSLEVQYELAQIARQGQQSVFDPTCHRDLLACGYITQGGGSRVSVACRLIGNTAQQKFDQSAGLKRLFEVPLDFERNMRTVLSLRLANVRVRDYGVDTTLRVMVEHLNAPVFVLQQIRGLVNQAVALILAVDLPDRTIPYDWALDWGWSGLTPGRAVPLPGDEGRRCDVLRQLTDTRRAGSSCASRATYCLINHLHGVGNLGQHTVGERIEGTFAIAVCLDAIQLVAQLNQELP